MNGWDWFKLACTAEVGFLFGFKFGWEALSWFPTNIDDACSEKVQDYKEGLCQGTGRGSEPAYSEGIQGPGGFHLPVLGAVAVLGRSVLRK